MAAGRPIVATDIGGIPDAVTDQKEGLLVPAMDPAAFASAIGAVLDDPALAEELATAAYQRARRDYGIDSVARRIESIYREELQLFQDRV